MKIKTTDIMPFAVIYWIFFAVVYIYTSSLKTGTPPYLATAYINYAFFAGMIGALTVTVRHFQLPVKKRTLPGLTAQVVKAVILSQVPACLMAVSMYFETLSATMPLCWLLFLVSYVFILFMIASIYTPGGLRSIALRVRKSIISILWLLALQLACTWPLHLATGYTHKYLPNAHLLSTALVLPASFALSGYLWTLFIFNAIRKAEVDDSSASLYRTTLNVHRNNAWCVLGAVYLTYIASLVIPRYFPGIPMYIENSIVWTNCWVGSLAEFVAYSSIALVLLLVIKGAWWRSLSAVLLSWILVTLLRVGPLCLLEVPDAFAIGIAYFALLSVVILLIRGGVRLFDKQPNKAVNQVQEPVRELVFETLDQGKMPEAWYSDSLCCTFNETGMLSGPLTEVQMLLPGNGWRRVRVEVEMDAPDGSHVFCDHDNAMRMDIDIKSKYARHSAFRHQFEMEHSTIPVPADKPSHLVAFEFDYDTLSASVDKQDVVTATDPYPRPTARRLIIGFMNDCLVKSVRVLGEGELIAPLYNIQPKANDDFFLEVCVDPFDDLIPAAFTRNTFDELFAELKSWGTRRVQWIYYGKREDGWWDYSTWGVPRNAAKTYDNVGDMFKVAVESAHAHGLEIYGLLKPFDMGLRASYGEGTPEAQECGRVPMVGGPVGWVTKFAAEHRELIMSRKPDVYGDAENEVFNRIDLVKDDDGSCAFTVNDIEILVSDDNATYAPYTGPITRTEVVEDYPLYVHTASGAKKTDKTVSARVFRFDGLEIRSKYFALAVAGREGSFNNNPANMIHVFGENGEESKLTYGYMERLGLSGEALPFREHGVEFDSNPMVTAVCAGGYDAVRAYFPFDSGLGFFAVGRGKEPGPLAALSPSFPETREWWLSWVKDILDAGADGVEMRVRNHHSILAWGELGFEQPVVDEFQTRYGVDLLSTDDFDRAAFRKLRGEAYTKFYREARELVKSYGKKLGLHVSTTMDTEPEQGAAMEIQWDWQTWLKEGLADGVTMKEVWPESRLGLGIFSYTRAQGIPAVFCPYANHYWNFPPYSNLPGGERVIESMINVAKEGGCDGYQFYECAAVVRATPDGHIEMRTPELREVFRKYFVK